MPSCADPIRRWLSPSFGTVHVRPPRSSFVNGHTQDLKNVQSSRRAETRIDTTNPEERRERMQKQIRVATHVEYLETHWLQAAQHKRSYVL
jgi:hypothetical protein